MDSVGVSRVPSRLSWVVVFVVALLCLGLTGCEEAETVSSTSSSSGTTQVAPGIVQSRGDETIIALLPVSEELPAASLSSLRHRDLFELLYGSEAVRARGFDSADSRPQEFLFYGTANHKLGPGETFFYEFNQDLKPNQAQELGIVPSYSASYGFLSWRLGLGNLQVEATELENQTLTFSNGTVEAVVSFRKVGDGYDILVNDQRLQTMDFSKTLTFVLPLECGIFDEVEQDVLKAYLGRWTVSAEPPIQTVGLEQMTPFDFDLNSLVVDQIEKLAKEPLPPDEPGGEPKFAGYLFKADLKVEGTGTQQPADGSGSVFWKARITNNAGDTIKSTFYGESGFFDSSGENGHEVVIDWDGTNDNGEHVAGDEDYHVYMQALISDDNTSDIPDKTGTFRTLSEATTNPFREPPVVVTPEVYPEIDPDNLYVEDLDGDGELTVADWPGEDYDGDGIIDEYFFPESVDTDSDGIPDTPVDPDGDGIPDEPPYQRDYTIRVQADLDRPGYKISSDIVLTIKTEDGEDVLHTQTFSARDRINYFWDPTAEDPIPLVGLGAQQLRVELAYTLCFDERIKVSVLNQTVDPCFGILAEGGLALGNVLDVEISSVTFGGSEALTTSFETGPYKVFDYVTKKSPNETSNEAHWKSETGEMYPAVMGVGNPVFVGARFEVKTSTPSDAMLLVRAKGNLDGEVIEFGVSEPIPKSDWNLPVVFSFELDNEINRYGLSIEWEFAIEDRLGRVITPSSGRKHRVYTVSKGGPRKLLSGGSIVSRYTSQVSGADGIWYNSGSFEDNIPISKPSFRKTPTRSPLDLATHWAKGLPVSPDQATLEQREAIIEAISRNLYANGGYIYTPTTHLASHQSSALDLLAFSLGDSLRGEKMECRDAAGTAAAYARMLGIDCNFRLINLPFIAQGSFNPYIKGRYALFTKYLNMIGETAETASEEGGYWIAPLSAVPFDFFGVGFDQAPGKQGTNEPLYPWKQWNFAYHMIIEISQGGQKVIDPVARVDSNFTFNEDYVLNQLNGPGPGVRNEALSEMPLEWQRLYGSIIPPGLVDRFGTRYELEFDVNPRLQRAITLTEYVTDTFYLMEQPQSVREREGYNSFFDILQRSSRKENLRLNP